MRNLRIWVVNNKTAKKLMPLLYENTTGHFQRKCCAVIKQYEKKNRDQKLDFFNRICLNC